MKLKTITSALAGAGVLAFVCSSGVAQAGAMASSMVNMTNFVINKASSTTGAGATQVSASDLLNLEFSSTYDYSAALNGGAPLGGTGGGSSGPGTDAPVVCTGTGCDATTVASENWFGKPAAPVTGLGNYAAADQLENGTPVLGLTGYTRDSAHVANSAYVAIENGSGSASSTSNNSLDATWQFTSGFTGFMQFEFDIDAYIQVALDAGEIATTDANATYNISFTLSCGESNNTTCGLFGLDSVSFNPDLFASPAGDGAKTVGLTAPKPGAAETTRDTATWPFLSSTHLTSIWIPVIEGTNMQLAARITTEADVTRTAAPTIPEPNVLALLGLGLFGLGAGLRKKKIA